MTAQSKKKNKRNKKGQDEGGKKDMPATPKQEEVKVEDVPVEGVKAEATPAAEEPQVEAAPPVEKKQKKRKETVRGITLELYLNMGQLSMASMEICCHNCAI